VNIIYYTSGITGSGRVVRGISIGNALRRKGVDCEYAILSGSHFSFLTERLNIKHIEIPLEDEEPLSKSEYKYSALYRTLMETNPDVLIIDLLWFSLYHFIHELPCKRIFLCRQVDDEFFSIEFTDESIKFRPGDYDILLAIEPFSSSIQMKQINPIVIRNRDEILSRKEALIKLGIDDDQKNCFITYNGEPGEFEEVKKKYSYLDEVGYQVVTTSNYEGGLFPSVDYFNAFDLIICGAGYNSYWEVVYFDKDVIFSPAVRLFETGERRINECQGYTFDENGADQLVDIIMNM